MIVAPKPERVELTVAIALSMDAIAPVAVTWEVTERSLTFAKEPPLDFAMVGAE